MKHTGFIAYFGGEFTFWIVAALSAGVISCVADQNNALSYVLGGIAACCVFVLLYRTGEESSRGRGLFYCERCQHYYKPERFEGKEGAT